MITKRTPSPHVPNEPRVPVRKAIKRNNKILQATHLPSVMNINPRSIYNKTNEFVTMVEQYESQLIFISESWDRIEQPLETIIKIDGYKIYTAVNPRSFRGGKPAIMVNEEKFHVQNLSPEPITVPYGVEAVWVLLTPKSAKPNVLVKHIAAASIYYRGPKSTRKDALFDHIAQTFTFLNAKYGQGLHYIIAGDTNRLNLSPILNLSPSLRQCVSVPTRLNPPVTLDPIITTLHNLYQIPITKPPLQNDGDKIGKPSDHLVVLMYPISAQITCPPRKFKHIQCRPLPQSGMNKLGNWIQQQTWREIHECEDAHTMAKVFQKMLVDKMNECLPVKTLRISSDDKPWMNKELKDLDRKCKREYQKHQKSEKWGNLRSIFKLKCKIAKKKYYEKTVHDLKTSNISQWYSKVKRMGGVKQDQQDQIFVDELSGLDDIQQAEIIAKHYAKISNEYKHLETEDIPQTLYDTSEAPPRIEAYEIHERIQKMSSKKSTVRNDIPMKIIKEFSVELAEPLEIIFNHGLYHGQYPDIWKFQQITPAPKIYPPKQVSDLRPISGLKNFAKIYESFLAKYLISDMQPNKDPAQYGNEKGLSITHYLVKMIHIILTAVDDNTEKEAKAVIVQLIDWKGAFDRQCHQLGVRAFLDNGARKTLIPILISYFQNRQMAVKWNGKFSAPYPLPGGGAQGGELGQLEYMAQSNNNTDFLDEKSKYKFIDDLSILEVINLVMCGLVNYNFKAHVASDVASHGKFLPTQNVNSQNYLEKISQWTKQNKMSLNTQKSKFMVFNYTKKYQFSTRLVLDETPLEEISECKLLGVIIENNMSFKKNTQSIIKRAYKRMIILEKLYEFHLPVEEMINIYILFIRSVVEQSCVVWHSALSEDDHIALERVQKAALRIILDSKYTDYKSALFLTNLETLRSRRKYLCLKFAQKCVKTGKLSDLFPIIRKNINTRPHEKFHITKAKTERLAKSTVPYLQRLLNENW